MTTCRRRGRTLASAALFGVLACTPASAQTSLSGVWSNFALFHEDEPDRLPGPELGDYSGIPVNDAVRLRADSWDASLITLPEYQCRVHPSDYAPSFGPIRIWEERDQESQQLLAIKVHHFAWGTERSIWMDGRPHPGPDARHTAMGFSTGKWEGDILTVTTTHLKEGWIRRNGITRSDRATVTEHFIRHGNIMTLMTVVNDPIYMTETHVRSRDYEYDLNFQVGPYPCEPVTEVERPAGAIPHHLPGTNPFLEEYAKAHGVPIEGARGGAETLYPEYHKQIAAGRAGKK